MVKISKVTKTKKAEKSIWLEKQEAIEFLYGLGKNDFAGSDYFVVDTNPQYEMEELVGIFSSDFLEMVGAVDILKVNPKTIKKERMRNKSVSVMAIKKFAKKFQDYTNTTKLEIDMMPEEFSILCFGENFASSNVRFTCDYTLQIKKIELVDIMGNSVGTFDEIQKMKTSINNILSKQRYYYRRIKK